jgi:hypothetical protein
MAEIWDRLRKLVGRLWATGMKESDRPRRSPDEARARFWSELREGQREAETRSRPR